MNILVSGSSGLIGSALLSFLQQEKHNVIRLVRKATTNEKEIFWNPNEGNIDFLKLENVDAVIHLAGENIAAQRWSEQQKQRILESRITGTTLLSETISKLIKPPKVFISASAIGFYGESIKIKNPTSLIVGFQNLFQFLSLKPNSSNIFYPTLKHRILVEPY